MKKTSKSTKPKAKPVTTPEKVFRAIIHEEDISKRVKLLMQDPVAAPIIKRVTREKGTWERGTLGLLAFVTQSYQEKTLEAKVSWVRALQILGYSDADVPVLSIRLLGFS